MAPSLLQEGLAVEEFVNADAIALGLSAFRPEAAAIAAGRVMLERLAALGRTRRDFAFETTLAGRVLPVIRKRGFLTSSGPPDWGGCGGAGSGFESGSWRPTISLRAA
jgi:hypothetical protein